ncbi:MFS transporter [soil metagenome]
MTLSPETLNPATTPIAIAMQRPAWRDTFSALRLHNYRLYVVTQFIANTAGWMQRIAVDWLVLEITGSVALVGLTIAIQFLPTIILGAYAGVVADRLPKRAVLYVCQGIVAVLSVVLALVALTGAAHLWLIYSLVFLIGVAQVFDLPARTVFVSEMVGPRHLRNAISVNASIFHLGALLGPGLSGLLIVAVGSGWAIGANSVAAVIGILLLLAIRKRELLIAPRSPNGKGQIREAARYIRSKPTLFWTLLLVFVVATFGMSLPVLLAGMANSVLMTGAGGYGLYNSLVAVGSLTGALVSTRRASLRLRTIVFGAVIYGTLLALSGLASSTVVFLALLVGVGLSRLLYMTASETMVQLSSNMAIRGRVMAFWVLIVVGGQAIGGPLMGWVAQTLGPDTALIIAGVVPALAAITIAIVLARTGRLRVRVAAKRGKWVAIVPRPKMKRA